MEMVLYIVLLVFVMSIIIQTLISMGEVYRNIKITRELEISGTIAMESMIREIRNASDINLGLSNFTLSPGTLVVSGIDEGSNPYEVAFNVSAGVLQISKNSETPVALTSSQVSVNYLLFSRLATSTSQGIRIELEVSNTAGSIPKSEKFYDFAVLRGSY